MRLEDRPASHRAGKVVPFLATEDLQRLRGIDLETRKVDQLPDWAQRLILAGEQARATSRAAAPPRG